MLPRQPRSGVTLLELLLVVTLVMIAAALAYPLIEAMGPGIRIKAAADLIRANWADCRSQAIEEGRAYRFAIVPNTGRFRVAPESSEFWSGGDGGRTSSSSFDDTPPLIVEDELPEGVKFASGGGGGEVSSSGEWQTVVTFLPDGTAREDVEISFSASGTRSIVLKLKALTGAVTQQLADAEKSP